MIRDGGVAVSAAWTKRFVMVVMLAALTVMMVPRALAKPPEGKWTTDIKTGLSQAREENRPVLMMFSATWCGPCNQMKKDVFTQDRVKRILEGYESIYIDGDEHSEMMKQYKVRFYPTFVIMKPDGTEQGRFFGYNPAEKFLEKVDTIQRQLPGVEQQIAQTPKDPALWKKRGQLLESIENPDMLDLVYESYRKAKSLDPQDRTSVAADVAFFQAARITKDGPEGADKRFADFVERYPNSPRVQDALFNRIDIAMRQNESGVAKAMIALYQQKYPKGKYDQEIQDISKILANPHQAGRELGRPPQNPRSARPPQVPQGT